MSNSKRKLSLAGSREPFGKVTSLEQIPSALFEILCLARELKTPKGDQIVSLVDDVITVALSDPESWLKLENMAANGYKTVFSRQESEIS
ncbi:MAG: hypothetical protein L0226_14625 [Acidobacteria bacterium]|nr:hypothetical protein [Acidobacteriota bacterium]